MSTPFLTLMEGSEDMTKMLFLSSQATQKLELERCGSLILRKSNFNV
jgi:hypothetical protein